MEELNDRIKKKRIYIISFISIVTVLGIIIWTTNQVNRRFSIGKERFRYIGEEINDTKNIIFKDKKNNILTVSIEEKGDTSLYLAEKYTIYYLDKVIICDASHGAGIGRKIILSNGRTYEQYVFSSLPRMKEKNNKPYDVQLVDGIEEVINFNEGLEGYILTFFLILSVPIAVGLIGVIYPRELWKFQHFLCVEKGEPTDFALNMSVLGGILIILFTLILYPIVIK